MTFGGWPARENSMAFGPPVELLSRIAWRRDPGPESFVFVTVKTAA
jgi:hypothetical protein